MNRITAKEALELYYKAREPQANDLLNKIDAAIKAAASKVQACALVYTPFITRGTVDEVLIDLKKRGFKASFSNDPTAHFTITF
ncbi:MAG: hypothetical protein ACRYFZ_00885 [Janthinobacterium lividum]